MLRVFRQRERWAWAFISLFPAVGYDERIVTAEHLRVPTGARGSGNTFRRPEAGRVFGERRSSNGDSAVFLLVNAAGSQGSNLRVVSQNGKIGSPVPAPVTVAAQPGSSRGLGAGAGKAQSLGFVREQEKARSPQHRPS